MSFFSGILQLLLQVFALCLLLLCSLLLFLYIFLLPMLPQLVEVSIIDDVVASNWLEEEINVICSI